MTSTQPNKPQQDNPMTGNNYLQQEQFQRNHSVQIGSFIQMNQLQKLEMYLRQYHPHPSIMSLHLSTYAEANHDNPEMLNLLLANKADVNARLSLSSPSSNQDMTILMYSIKISNLNLFNIIMNYSPNILLTDSQKLNAAIYSILYNDDLNLFLLMKLLSINPQIIHSTGVIDKSEHNLLTLATLKNKSNFVKILLQTQIDINYVTEPERDTALHIAVRNNNYDLAELLMKQKKIDKGHRNIEQKTPRDIAKEFKGKIYYRLFMQRKLGEFTIPIAFDDDNNSMAMANMETMIQLGNNTKLCIDINPSYEDIIEEQKHNDRMIQDANALIEAYERKLVELDGQIEEKTKTIKQKDSQVENNVLRSNSKKTQMIELKNQLNDYRKYIQSQSDPNAQYTILIKKFSSVRYNDNFIIPNLQRDLLDYEAHVKEKITSKTPVITDLINLIQAAVNEINPLYIVNLFGSYATGLCLPWSDLDVVLTVSNGHYDDYFLGKLYSKLITKPWILSHKFLENASVPIIKLISNDSNQFNIDISIASEKHMGLKCVDLVKSFLDAYPALKPIVLALKTLLYNGNYNDPYKGGLSSYGLILIIVSHIQSAMQAPNYVMNNPYDLGKTFLEVLGHFGIFFEYNKFVIITHHPDDIGNTQDKDNYPIAQTQHELVIVDPLNKQNNVAKSSYQFVNIKMAFMIAYMVAIEDCECGCHFNVIQNNNLLQTEHCILKRIFNSVKRFNEANNYA